MKCYIEAWDLIFFDNNNIARFYEVHMRREKAQLRFSDFLNECRSKGFENSGHAEIRGRDRCDFWHPIQDKKGNGWVIT